MRKEQIRSKSTPAERRNTQINVKLTQKAKDWIKAQQFSPTVIFNQALKDLGCPYAGDRK